MKNIIIITDANEDPDDLAMLIMAGALHKMAKINLLGVVTTVGNKEMRQKRAHYAKGVLSHIGLSEIPVCPGIGYSMSYNNRRLNDSIFIENEYLEQIMSRGEDILTFAPEFLIGILEKAEDKSITIVNVAGFSDINYISEIRKEMFLQKVKEVFIMGGIEENKKEEIQKPNEIAHNNCIDPFAANKIHEFLQVNNIDTYLLNSKSVKMVPVNMQYYSEVAKNGDMLAKHLMGVQKQALGFHYNAIINNSAEAKYTPEWFYKNYTSLKTEEPLDFDYVWEHVDKLYLYDPMALILSIDECRNTMFEINKIGRINNCVPKDKEGIYKLFKELPSFILAK